MKISKATLAVLKNFAGINGNIWITSGNLIMTKSAANNITAEATVPETFDSDFGVYDLNEFLGVMGLFADPELSFKGTVVNISEGRNKVKYFSADKSILTVPKARMSFDLIDTKSAVSFTLTQENLAQIIKTAAVLKAPNVSFIGDGKTLSAVVHDVENKSSNSYTMEIEGATFTNTGESVAHFRVENLKMIPNEYEVDLSYGNVARFQNGALVYHVAIEDGSAFS